jgi:crotonobetainyl-CoA:carnitine CoA-transferase CaiB-like acyl-CoA transferase
MTNASKPLSSLRVLDFGHTIMGPCAGVLFADLGADVIKIEPAEGDPTRSLPGFAAGFFATYNRNKRSIAVDLKRAEGQAIVHRLIKNADIVLENFGPGTIERLKCGWEDLKNLNPRLIYLSMKGFLKGPYENRGALDEVVQMQSGLAYMTGPPGRPLRAGAPVIDILGGVFGVVAALSALRERDRTGLGQKVGSSLFESATFMLGAVVVGSAVTGGPMPPMPARKNAWGIYDVFTTADGGQVFIGCTSDGHWLRFCEQFGFDDWRGDPRLASNSSRCDAREWMLPELERRLKTLTLDDILAKCEVARVAYSRVGRPDELSNDPHLLAHGGLLATAVSGLGGGPLVGIPALPIEFGDERERMGLERQPPHIGEHTDQILSEAGYSEHEIATLRGTGVLGGSAETSAVSGDERITRSPLSATAPRISRSSLRPISNAGGRS